MDYLILNERTMTCLIYSLLSWLYRGIETEEKIQKRLRNAQAELDQSNSPGLFDHLLVNDDLETYYENLKNLLSLDDDQEDSDALFIKDGKTNCQLLYCVKK